MLQNAYLLAKIGADTAENERNLPNIWQKLATTHSSETCAQVPRGSRRGARRRTRPTRRSGPAASARVSAAKAAPCGKFYSSRSRLYQNEILQEKISKYAFDSIFQSLQDLHTFAPLQSQNFSKHRFEKSAIFVKFQQIIANVAKFAKFCHISKIAAR